MLWMRKIFERENCWKIHKNNEHEKESKWDPRRKHIHKHRHKVLFYLTIFDILSNCYLEPSEPKDETKDKKMNADLELKRKVKYGS